MREVPPNCPFCLSNNLLKGGTFAENDDAFLLEPSGLPGTMLVVPKMHVESVTDLPDDWWRSFKASLRQMPAMPEQFNLSLNIGKDAGQSVKHLHFWIVPRSAGQPSSGRGLASLVAAVDGSDVKD